MSIVIHKIKLLTVNKAGTRTDKVSLSLSSSANATINAQSINSKFTLSAASLSFTTSNWYIPQSITITGVNDAVNDDCVFDTLRLTGDGTVDVPVAVIDDADLFVDFGIMRWADEKEISSLSDATTKRASLIASIFNGNGIPTNYTPAGTSSGVTGTIHSITTSQLTNSSGVDRYTFTHTDIDGYTWTYYCFHCKTNQTPVNKIVFIDGGHTIDGGVETSDQIPINAFNAIGIDCMYIAMPIAGQNTTTNPNIDTSSITITTRHNQFIVKRLDRPGYCALELFLSGGLQAVNWVVQNYPNYQISCFSLSGGSHFATWAAALNENIDKIFVCRGIVFRALSDTTAMNGSDYEYGGNRFSLYRSGKRLWDITNYCESIDRLILAATNGREVYIMHNTNDTALVAAAGEHNLPYREWLSTVGSAVNGTVTLYVSTDAAYSAHQYHQVDTDYVIAHL